MVLDSGRGCLLVVEVVGPGRSVVMEVDLDRLLVMEVDFLVVRAVGVRRDILMAPLLRYFLWVVQVLPQN